MEAWNRFIEFSLIGFPLPPEETGDFFSFFFVAGGASMTSSTVRLDRIFAARSAHGGAGKSFALR